MARINTVEVVDVRFPPPAARPGCEATGGNGAQSAAYVVVRSDAGVAGRSLVRTGGQSTELCVLAARDIAESLVGSDVDELAGSLGETYRRLVDDNDSGSERGVKRLAAAGVLNAIWDLVARHAGKPLWRLVVDMEPADLVAACDFRDLTDVLTPHEAQEMLERLAPSRAERISHLAGVGYPAYTSGPGSLDYTDDKLRRLCREAVANGWHAIMIEVGRNVGHSKRRLAIARDELGPDGTLLVQPHQMWGVPEAIARATELARFAPLRFGTPTSPDDIAGHAAIRPHPWA
jgi:L-fuconate dehydratase